MSRSKKEDTKKRIHRLFSLLCALESAHPYLNLRQYAKKAGIHQRTAQRDIKLLQAFNYPIINLGKPEQDADKREKQKGKNKKQKAVKRGFYKFRDGFALKQINITPREQMFISLIKNLLSHFDDTFSSHVKEFDHLFTALPEENPLFIKLPQTQLYYKNIQLEPLLQSILQKQLIHITYSSTRMTLQYTNFQPLKICLFSGFWYLVGYQLGQRNLLKFRLEKIQKIQFTQETFVYKGNINKQLQQATNMWFNEGKTKQIKLQVDAQVADYFKKKIYFPNQTIKETSSGNLILHCKSNDYMEIAPTVRSWLPHIQIISPKAWHKRLVEELKVFLQKTNNIES